MTTLRNISALVLFAVVLMRSPVAASISGCGAPEYVQQEQVCQVAVRGCQWDSGGPHVYAGETFEQTTTSCDWFQWTDFNWYIHTNFDPFAFTTNWMCWDHCPDLTPWECGTYGIFDVEWSYWGECPEE